MATNKSNNRPVAAAEKEPKTVKNKAESIYTAAELANAYKTFGTSYAIVATALKLAGKEKATVAETKKIIEKFEKREVK